MLVMYFFTLKGGLPSMPDNNATPVVPGISKDDLESLQAQLDTIKDNRVNPGNIKKALDLVAGIICRSYGLSEITTALLDTERDLDFFGVNIYPCENACCGSTRLMLGCKENQFEDIKHEWNENKCWHMDFDAKLFFNPSVVFNSAEIAAIVLYEVERVIFSYDLAYKVFKAIKVCLLNMNCLDRKIAKNPICSKLFFIPFLQICELKDFKTEDMMDANSILMHSSILRDQYLSGLTKIVTGYGNDTINRQPAEIEQKIAHVLTWIFEGINDLQYSMYLMKKNLREYIIAEKSEYVKHIMVGIFNDFANFEQSSMLREAYIHHHPVTETMKDIEDAKQLSVFKKRYEKVKEEAEFSIFDKYGRCKKITQEEIDVLRIEVSKIESADDKIYLLEKLYDKLDIVNKSLDMLEDKDLRSKVKQPKDFLLKMKSQLEDIRQLIFSVKATPKRYGLFIEYPPGYEG